MAQRSVRRRPREAIISGYLLKLIRESVQPPVSQERLAELLRVERNTLQGWESGRRPLTSTQAGTLLRLQARLRVLGADPMLLAALPGAMEADHLLADLMADDREETPLDEHPLSRIPPMRMRVGRRGASMTIGQVIRRRSGRR